MELIEPLDLLQVKALGVGLGLTYSKTIRSFILELTLPVWRKEWVWQLGS